MSWGDLPPDRQSAAKVAAEEVINRLAGYAILDRAPLSEWDFWVLHHGVHDLISDVERYISEGRTMSEAAAYEARIQAAFGATIDRVVRLIRSSIERDKRVPMLPLVKPRAGLVLPLWWEERYQLLYVSEIPWTISAAFQSALLGYPPFGEGRAWVSR